MFRPFEDCPNAVFFLIQQQNNQEQLQDAITIL